MDETVVSNFYLMTRAAYDKLSRPVAKAALVRAVEEGLSLSHADWVRALLSTETLSKEVIGPDEEHSQGEAYFLASEGRRQPAGGPAWSRTSI